MNEPLPSFNSLLDLAIEIGMDLERNRKRFALAESCTGGLASGTLASVPGMSKYLCGSFVVYTEGTKKSWLGVPPEALLETGPVSRGVAEAMARRALELTPEAQIAVSITGHLGPHAPQDQDGHAWIGRAQRGGDKILVKADLYQLDPFAKLTTSGRRLSRLLQATQIVLETLRGEVAIGN
jgi:nicotinamide-nucleotide amidase